MKACKRIEYLFADNSDLLRKIIYSFHRRLDGLLKGWCYSSYGKRTLIYKPVRVMGAQNIWLGSNVTINKGAYLYALEITDQKPRLCIGNGTTIGFYCHIVAVGAVNIGNKVLIADKVYIGDNAHCYEDISIPIIDQGVRYTGAVDIGEGTWVGDNVTIVSCKVGKNCVIGANSFVNSDIPDYSMACGTPAKIIKRYNLSTKRWEKI